MGIFQHPAKAKTLLDASLSNAGDADSNIAEIRLYCSAADIFVCLLKSSSGTTDSFVDVLSRYGIEIRGDSFDELYIEKVSPSDGDAVQNNLLRSYITNKLMPKLVAADALFSELADSDFVTSIPAGSGVSSSTVEIDKGDILAFKTAAKAAEAVCSYLVSLNVDANPSSVEALLNSATEIAPSDIKNLVDSLPQLLRFDSSSNSAAAKQYVVDAINSYLAMSQYIRTEDTNTIVGAEEFIKFASGVEDDEADLRSQMSTLLTALQNNSAWAFSDQFSLNANLLFEASGPDLRDMLPVFDNSGFVESGTAGAGLGNDPTLGGVLPGFSQEKWSQIFSSLFGGMSGFHYEDKGAGFPDLSRGVTSNSSYLFVSVGQSIEVHRIPDDVTQDSFVSSLSLDDAVYMFQADENYLYVSDGIMIARYRIESGTLTEPQVLVQIGSGCITAFSVDTNRLAYLQNDGSGFDSQLNIIDLRQDGAVTALFSATVPSIPGGFEAYGGALLLRGDALFYCQRMFESNTWHETSTVYAYDLSLSGTSPLGHISVDTYVTQLIERNGFLYLGAYGNPITLVDVSNREGLRIVADAFPDDVNVAQFKIFGNTLIGVGNPISAFDISTPSNPRFIASMNKAVWPETMLISNGKALVSAYTTAQYCNISLLDADGDGLEDSWENSQLGSLQYSSDDDPDGDGLANSLEMVLGATPLKADTDNDGMSDGWEYQNSLFVTKNDASADLDGDGASNVAEYEGQSDPSSAESLPVVRAHVVPIAAIYILLGQ